MEAKLDVILGKAVGREELSRDEVSYLLSLRDSGSMGRLFETARVVKERNFGNKVFLYGFVYFSTHCRNDCSFCFYRRSNQESVRYRKRLEEVVALASDLDDAGVHLIDLTMGEDPQFRGPSNWDALLEVVSAVNETTDLPIMASPGTLPQERFGPLRDAGADWFACYQETHNKDLFSRLRPHQDYDVRLNQKRWARRSGMLTEEGIMIGVGESIEDRAASIEAMGQLGVQQVRAMTFVPQKNTPMELLPPTPYLDELVTLAVMRLVHQDKLIPASLDIEGAKGLRPRLDAGANVITSIIPPREGLAGVAQHELDIDTGDRSAGSIERMLDELDVRVASPGEYRGLVDGWKSRISVEGVV
jgi:methylornithine synthase